MKQDESFYLRHILDAIVRVEEYLQGLDEAAFIRNSLVQDGVIRQIEIIGEATKRLSSQLRVLSPRSLGRHRRDARQTHSRLFRSRH